MSNLSLTGYSITTPPRESPIGGIEDIKDAGQNYLASLESRADKWREFAEEQYSAITDLLANWADPTEIDTSLPGLSVSLDPVGLASAVAFTQRSTTNLILPTKYTDPDYDGVKDTATNAATAALTVNLTPATLQTTVPSVPDLDTQAPSGGIDFTFDSDLVGDLPTIADLPDIQEPADFYGSYLPSDTALDGITTALVMPVMDPFAAPAFAAVAPEFAVDAPDAMDYEDTAFTHTAGFESLVIKVLEQADTMLSTLAAKVVADLEAGSSGIDPAVEQAMYDRAVSRLDSDYAAREAEMAEYFAARGFAMPPGAQVSALMEMNLQRGRAVTELNNDIVVQRSNLTQQNLQALLQSGTQLQSLFLTSATQIEDLFVRAHNDMQNRAFETQKAIAEHALDIYKAGVEKYKADQEQYKALLQKYAEDIKLEIAKADVFRTQMEGVKAQAAASELIISVYNAKLSKAKLLTEAYDAQTSMLTAISAAERIKLDVYRAGIESVSLGIEKYKAEWQAYAQRSDADKTKLLEWESSLKIAEHELAKWNSTRESHVKIAGLKLEESRTKLEGLKVQLAAVDTRDKQSMARLAALDGHDDVRARIHAINEENKFKSQDMTIRNNMARLEQARIESTMQIERMRTELAAKVEEYRLSQEKLKSQANVMAQIAASALSTMSNSLAFGHSSSISGNLGLSESYSRSSGYSFSDSRSFDQSQRESWNTNTNFNYGDD